MAGIKGLFAGTELGDREKKNLLILDAIRKKGPVGRTDISKITGFNIVTVSNYIDHYIKEGLVSEGGYDTSSGGRKPMLVNLNHKSAYFIGVGYNIANIIAVLIDLHCNIVYQIKKKRPPQLGKELINNLADVVAEILNKCPVEKEKIKGIGFAISGIIDSTNMTIRWSTALGTPDILVSASLWDMLRNRFGIPVVIENDADCAAFGEQWIVLTPEMKDVLYMYSGVSCGIIVNSQIYKGSSGCAGELGIANLQNRDKYDWKKESYGIGKWNMELGLLDNIDDLYNQHSDSMIFKLVKNNPKDVTFTTIIDAAKSDDKFAIQLLGKAGEDLGKKIAFLVNLLNPQIVVIGGGVEAAGSFLFDTLKKTVKEWAFEEATRNLKIVPAQLAESAVPLGAASVVVQKYFEQV